jgi:uncharacterized BrkB/YihY/UPF0761 family membrane protein
MGDKELTKEDLKKYENLGIIGVFAAGVIFLLIGVIVFYYGLGPCLEKEKTKIIVGIVFSTIGTGLILAGKFVSKEIK